MEPFVWILIIFGIIPTVFAFIYSQWSSRRLLKNTRYRQYRSGFKEPALPKAAPVPRAQLGSSFPGERTRRVREVDRITEPQFSTLHCRKNQVGKAKWQLEIEFEIRNRSSTHEIVIDDIHASQYESNAFTSPYMTISHFGDVLLKQDNTILKENRVYSLPPGDGYIMRLLLEATRVEGAPAYGVYEEEKEGQMLVVFGLLLDYYVNHPASGLHRQAIPSDCIYLFTLFEEAEIRTVNLSNLPELKLADFDDKQAKQFLRRLERYLEQHLSFRPTPDY